MSLQEMDGLLDLLVEALILRLEEDDHPEVSEMPTSETPGASHGSNHDRAS